MIHVVTPANVHMYSSEMEQAFRLRHKIFVEQLNWRDLAREDCREIDAYDDDHAVHMLAIRDGVVIGYQRMLPTTRPHLLTDVMPQLCDGAPPQGPQVWEWTRFCVAESYRLRGRTLNPVVAALLTGLVEWGLDSGVTSVVTETHPLWLLTLIQLHFRTIPLGLPQPIDGEDIVAIAAEFDRRTLARLRRQRGDDTLVLSTRFEPANRRAA